MNIEIDFGKIEAEVAADVAKGVMLFDLIVPRWRKEVKEAIGITDANCCPTAQVTGENFFKADLTKFGYDPSTAANHIESSLPGSDRVARQVWGAGYGLAVDEKYQQHQGQYSLQALAHAVKIFNDRWTAAAAVPI